MAFLSEKSTVWVAPWNLRADRAFSPGGGGEGDVVVQGEGDVVEQVAHGQSTRSR